MNLILWSARGDACKGLRDSWQETAGILLNLERLETTIVSSVECFFSKDQKVNVHIEVLVSSVV